MADSEIAALAVVEIIEISLNQQMFSALENTNFREIFNLSENADVKNCSIVYPFVTCDELGNPVKFVIHDGSNFYGSIDISLFPDTIFRAYREKNGHAFAEYLFC